MTSLKVTDATAELRKAVRMCFTQFEPAESILIACSGGVDSLALAKAASLEAEKGHLSVGALIIDHGWGVDSGQVCEKTSQVLTDFGLAPVIVEKLPAHTHNETTARSLRYEVFARVADEIGARAVLLAHTKNDQAETVLLRLARGSGATSLSGVPPRRGIYHRPLLQIDRMTTQAACQQWALNPWQDPANNDLVHARIRVRNQALPALVAALGPSVIDGLSRSAELLRDDAHLLDTQALQIFDAFFDPTLLTIDADKLAQEPPSMARRVLLHWASEVGVERSALNGAHVAELHRLLDVPQKQNNTRRVALPGAFIAYRLEQVLHCERT